MGRRVGAGVCLGQHFRPPWRHSCRSADRALSPRRAELVLGIFLVWRHHTLDQLKPASPRYIGRRAILPFIWAGIVSTLGLFLFYFAIRLGGVTVTIPVQDTYVIWGTLIAWRFLQERIPRYRAGGCVVDFWRIGNAFLGAVQGASRIATLVLGNPSGFLHRSQLRDFRGLMA